MGLEEHFALYSLGSVEQIDGALLPDPPCSLHWGYSPPILLARFIAGSVGPAAHEFGIHSITVEENTFGNSTDSYSL